MNQLTRNLPQVGQLIRQGRWFSPLVVLSLVGLEILGRRTWTDWQDAVAGIVVSLLMLMVYLRHRTNPLGWVDKIHVWAEQIYQFFARLKPDIGLDLRGTPAIRRRVPPSTFVLIGILVLWSAGAAACWYWLPETWRWYAIQGSYLLYLIGLMFLWGTLLIVALAGCFLPLFLVTQLFPDTFASDNRKRMMRSSMVFLFCYMVFTWSLSRLLPTWIILATCGVVLVPLTISLVRLPQDPICFLWRPHGTLRVYAVPYTRLLAWTSISFTLLFVALLLTANGGKILQTRSTNPDMQITETLGHIVGLLLPGIFASIGIWMGLLWKNNPARVISPTLHASGGILPAVWPQLQKIARQRGWNLRPAASTPDETDVCIYLVEPMLSQAKEFDPSWPLRVSLEDLQTEAVWDRLLRRDEIQKRRLVLRGLHRIFRSFDPKEFNTGAGFWFAPHLWFLTGLTRDDFDDGEGANDGTTFMRPVGPPYHVVFSRPVRAYLYQVMRTLEIDLIFIEDGIKPRKMKQVLRMMFEVIDKSAGKQRIEEIHFQGVPKIRVMIHDFQFDQPFESNRYPEPKFDDLARARILHIFRDRGDQEELLEIPMDFNWSPAPVLSK